MDYKDYKTTRAVVIERPHYANLREIKLTEPKDDAYICQTLFSAISTGTDMKTYKGMQHPEQCYYPLVPGYETAGIVVAKAPNARKDLEIKYLVVSKSNFNAPAIISGGVIIATKIDKRC